MTNAGELDMITLGPTADHAKDTCRMWNLKTNKVATNSAEMYLS